TLYSVPWRHIGSEVEGRQTLTTVTIYLRGELIKTHARKEKGRQTDYNDFPPDKVAFLQKTPAWCRTRAAQIGPACIEVIDTLLAPNVCYRLRAAQGILGLADKHGPERLDAACARALAAGDPSYKTIKGVLRAGTERDDQPAEAAGVDTPAFLRGQAGLFEEVAS
ncbi:MAG: Mu transposase domain-containing protein, partial [Acidimicrobiales bacterium]